MENKYTILLIDDQSESLIDLLKPAADYAGINIYESSTIKNGRSMLEDYHQVIDAVLLDLGFPDGSISGSDFLVEIKETYPSIPVFILTGSDNAKDIRTAVECIKSGAENYFGKTNIDPISIFNEIKNAISRNSKDISHQNLLRLIQGDVKPGIVVRKYKLSGKDIYYGSFVFQLAQIAVSNDEKEFQVFTENIKIWNKDVLSLISLFKSNISLNIRYHLVPGENKKINIYYIFNIHDETKQKVVNESTRLFNELNIYFNNNYWNIGDVYKFTRINTKEELENFLHPIKIKTNIKFFTSNNSFGVSELSIDTVQINDDEYLKRIHNSIKPYKIQTKLYKRLLEHLYNYDFDIVLDLILVPRYLNIEQVNKLKYSIDSFKDSLYSNESRHYLDEINNYLNNSSNIYQIFCFLYSPFSELPDNLSMAVSRDLFDDTSLVNTHIMVNVNPANIHLKYLEKYDISNTSISDIYSLNRTIELFRPPYPIGTAHKGIPLLQKNECVDLNFPDSGVVLGKADSKSGPTIVRLADEDLRKHAYIIGQTGTGKTTMLYSSIMQRIYSGNGVCLIDPHGDLYESVLSSIPENRKSDVIEFNPGNLNHTVRINLLDYNPLQKESKSIIVNEIFKILEDIYDMKVAGGPMFENYFRNTLMLLMSNPDSMSTITDFQSVLLDKEFRDTLIDECTDDKLKNWWLNAIKIGDYSDLPSIRNITPYLIGKLNFLNDNDYVSRIFSEPDSTINFRNVIDNNNILLIKLPKGILGELNVRFIGRVIFSKLLNAALSREDTPESERIDFTLFIDEFHNFTSSDIEHAMGEARKFRLNLVMANQNLGQLDQNLMLSILGNVGSLVFFRQGIVDANRLVNFYDSKYSIKDVINLPNFNCIGRLLMNNSPSVPFIFQTITKEELNNLNLL